MYYALSNVQIILMISAINTTVFTQALGPQRGIVLYDEGYKGGEIIIEK